MAVGDQSAELALLTEIRDLLRPVAEHYRDEYEERLAAREAARRAKVAELVASLVWCAGAAGQIPG